MSSRRKVIFADDQEVTIKKLLPLWDALAPRADQVIQAFLLEVRGWWWQGEGGGDRGGGRGGPDMGCADVAERGQGAGCMLADD